MRGRAPPSYNGPVSTAGRILVGYGTVVIGYGLVLGVALAKVRSAAPQAPRHLVTTHLSALMQGPVALGLAFGAAAVGFDSGVATAGAAILVVGLGLEALGGTLNWLRHTGDQFAERSAGYVANAASAPASIVGGAMLIVGTLASL